MSPELQPPWFSSVTCQERLPLVKSLTLQQCYAALEDPNLQGTVANAIENRIRLLEKIKTQNPHAF